VPTYETVFITLPSLTDQEETDLVSSLAQIVAADGGSLVANDRMGRRRLAYPLRKFEDGVYTRFLYDSTPEAPKELARRIRLSDKILRHLTVRLDPEWAEEAKEQWARDVPRSRRGIAAGADRVSGRARSIRGRTGNRVRTVRIAER
jgi:small subunit ribosomal protein S6